MPLSSRSSWPSPVSSSSWHRRPPRPSVSTKIAAFPYDQDWSNAGLITANDDWTGVTGVEGYRGDDLAAATAADPQTRPDATDQLVTDVIANRTVPGTYATGGVLEFATASTRSRSQGSGTADAPNLVFHLDLTGQTGTQFSFDARDIDGHADDAVQQIAVQYRVGGSGDYTNLPRGYVADATTASHGDAGDPQGRRAAGGHRRLGGRLRPRHDDRRGAATTSGSASTTSPSRRALRRPRPLSLTNPGPQTSTEGVAIPTLQLAATGGTPPLTYGATGLPPGLSIDTSNGQITGTPNTAAGSPFAVTVSVTDSAAVRDQRPRTSAGPSTRLPSA